MISCQCFGQDVYDLANKANLELSNRNYQQALELYNQVIDIVDDVNIHHYYYERAEAKFYLKDYTGAMSDVTESLNRRKDFCKALYLRGQLKMKYEDRNGACSDLQKANESCKDQYSQTLKNQCDKSWDYDKLYKVHFSDTTSVTSFVEAYYVGCKEKVVDTTYVINYVMAAKGNDWEIYYDNKFEEKMADFFTRNDTLYSIYYYHNGQRKSEDWTVDDHWIFSASWCENGQQTSSGNPSNPNYRTEINYYCNGNKAWQGNLWQGSVWGTEIRWYENGQKKSEKTHSEFIQSLADKDELVNQIQKEKYWDENGNETEPFQDVNININTVGAPIYISPERLNGAYAYYSIDAQKEYDNTMKLFSDAVYETAEIKSACKCNCGLVYATFLVDKEGLIQNVQLDNSLEECADNAFREAIKKLGKWTPGKLGGQPVDVMVTVALELERIK